MLLWFHDTEQARLVEPCFFSCNIPNEPRVVEPYCQHPTMGPEKAGVT